MFRSTPPGELNLSAVAVAELYYGAYISGRPDENKRRIAELVSRLRCLPFDQSCMEIYGRIRGELKTAGTPIGPNDLLIASIGIANGLTLVSGNVREFSRVRGLKIENWLAGIA